MWAKTPDYDSLFFDYDVKVIQSRIIDFIIYCKNTRGLSPAAINLYTAALKKWYIQNDILTINWAKVNSYKPEFSRVVEDEAYTREQIQKMVSICDLRDKALVLLLASTGCRIGSVPKLRLKDLVPIDEYDIYQITIYKKAKQQYISYCTPEARTAIDAYISYRSQCGERLNDQSPLFRKRFNRLLPLEVSIVKPITTWVIYWALIQLLNKSGVRPTVKMTEGQRAPKRTQLMISHGFRKYVISNFIRAKLEYNARERLVGHRKGLGLDQHYDRRPEEEIMAEYIKAIPFLTISREAQLEQQINEMEQIRKDDLEELRNEIDGLKRAINNHH